MFCTFHCDQHVFFRTQEFISAVYLLSSFNKLTISINLVHSRCWKPEITPVKLCFNLSDAHTCLLYTISDALSQGLYVNWTQSLSSCIHFLLQSKPMYQQWILQLQMNLPSCLLIHPVDSSPYMHKEEEQRVCTLVKNVRTSTQWSWTVNSMDYDTQITCNNI